MDCGGVFVKYVLFIFNILFVICGILLIVFGSIMLAHIGDVSSFSQTFNANSVPIAVLVLGCIIFIISFLGCCGAIRESSCSILTYSVFMLVLFLCQLALIIYVWTQRDKFLQSMDQIVDTIWKQHQTDQKVMDALQLSFDCCGKNGPSDYLFQGQLSLPTSCCGPSAKTCLITDVAGKQGCSKAFAQFWNTNTNLVRYAGLGVAAIELVAFIFACCLGNQVRNGQRRANY